MDVKDDINGFRARFAAIKEESGRLALLESEIKSASHISKEEADVLLRCFFELVDDDRTTKESINALYRMMTDEQTAVAPIMKETLQESTYSPKLLKLLQKCYDAEEMRNFTKIKNSFLEYAAETFNEETARWLLKEVEKNPSDEDVDDRLYYFLNNRAATLAQSNNHIENTLKKEATDEPLGLTLIRAAMEAQGSPEAENEFHELLFSEGEKRVCELDHIAMTYLIEHFTKQNFKALNALRRHYGLKLQVEEGEIEDVNLRTVRRIQFEGGLSFASEDNPFYEIQYSETYRNFIPDYKNRYKESEYEKPLSQSKAAKILKDHGYIGLYSQLPKTLKGMRVPPDIVPELNLKDLCHLMIEYKVPDDKKQKNQRFPMNWFTTETSGTDNLISARRAYWEDLSRHNPELCRFINRDMRRHNVPEEAIEKFWRHIEEYGNPNPWVEGEELSDRQRDVFAALHHYEALKDGGKNKPNNVITVMRYPDGLNSHDLQHEYDNPLVRLWWKSAVMSDEEIWVTTKPDNEHTVPVRLRTVLIANKGRQENTVRYYGGPDITKSQWVGSLQNMRDIDNTADKIATEQRLKEIRMNYRNSVLHNSKRKAAATLHKNRIIQLRRERNA